MNDTPLELSDNTIQEIETFGQLGFTLAELSIQIDIPELIIRNQFDAKNGVIYKSYMKGRLTAEASLRAQLLSSACNGSTPSLVKMQELFNKADNYNNNI